MWCDFYVNKIESAQNSAKEISIVKGLTSLDRVSVVASPSEESCDTHVNFFSVKVASIYASFPEAARNVPCLDVWFQPFNERHCLLQF